MSKKDASIRPTIETITPLPAPTIKSSGADTDTPNRRHGIKLLVLLGAFVVLLLGGGWLLYYLSQNPLSTNKVTSGPSPAPVKGGKSLLSRSRSHSNLRPRSNRKTLPWKKKRPNKNWRIF